MTTYITSDHHFRHKNIIEFCDRDFQTVEEMNERLVEKWNSVVSKNDAVIHIGDFVYTDHQEDVESYLDKLNGNIMLIEGNHDPTIDISTFSRPFVESTIARCGKYRFFISHRYESIPDGWTQWVIHGHTHNDTPFIHYDKNRVNVSVDVTNYKPISLSRICSVLDDTSNGQVVFDISNL